MRPAARPRHRQSLLRYLFPHSRASARNKLTNFRFETLPYFKHRAQSWIYSYIIGRNRRHQERKAAGKSILELVRKRARRSFGGLHKDNETARNYKVTMSGSVPGFGGEEAGATGERGSRRKKIAGYLKAANEIRQSYQQSYSEKWGNGGSEWDEDEKGIPGAFPDVAIISHGDEQLVLFPSYARRHHKETPNPNASNSPGRSQRNSWSNEEGPMDAEYWAREWQKFEDDRAIVDVDVRGWLYSPHRGPMTRKNRLLVGLARQLSGVPAPKDASRDQSPEHTLAARHKEHEARQEQEKIAEEAEQILRKGLGEEKVAAQGGYSERPTYESDSENIYGDGRKSGHDTPDTPDDAPGPGHLPKRPSWNQPSEMSQAELLTANAHLMARLRPFLTNPLVSTPITLFFYDEETSVSRTVQTNEAGHFSIRASLEFVPTHVRVLASEYLSCTEAIKISEPRGVSLISDVDDTIKHSSIGGGAREIFRNAFIRDLSDLTIDGVKEWYNTMFDMGAGVHYVSNSPWQLFPVLVSFFQKAGLPPGSYHLKQYSGMLQGIFEPVAERKKGTLEKIMRDFPLRKFILIGDSGEADLEVYTDVVLANPGKILAVFIRDVTTPETQGFFDSAMGPLSGDRRLNGRDTSSRTNSWDSRKTQKSQRSSIANVLENRPALPQRPATEIKQQTSAGPTMGKLIDFDDEPAQGSVHESHRQVMPRSTSFANDMDVSRRKSASDTSKKPPTPPAKPQALRGVASKASLTEAPGASNRGTPPAPPKSRRPLAQHDAPHPLAQIQSSADFKASEETYVSSARHKVSTAYSALPEVRSYMPGRGYSQQPAQSESSSNSSSERPSLPPRRQTGGSITKRLSWNSTDTSDDESYHPNDSPVNKKLDLWKRRWKRAKDILDGQGVALRSWRVGGDACIEAIQMVEKAMREMNVEGYGNSKGKTGSGGGEVKVKDLKR